MFKLISLLFITALSLNGATIVGTNYDATGAALNQAMTVSNNAAPSAMSNGGISAGTKFRVQPTNGAYSFPIIAGSFTVFVPPYSWTISVPSTTNTLAMSSLIQGGVTNYVSTNLAGIYGVKVDTNDTTPGSLLSKFQGTSSVNIGVSNANGNEVLILSSSGVGTATPQTVTNVTGTNYSLVQVTNLDGSHTLSNTVPTNNATLAQLASAGAAATNAITASTNVINGATLTGTIPLSVVPAQVVTNNNNSALSMLAPLASLGPMVTGSSQVASVGNTVSTNIAQFVGMPAAVSNFTSADMTGAFNSTEGEGYCTDGTNFYVMTRSILLKITNNAQWQAGSGYTLIASNMNTLASMPGLNHCGGIKYYNGKIYCTAENYVSIGSYSLQRIAIFNATTLAFISATDISGCGQEASGLAIATNIGRGLIFTTSYDQLGATEAKQLSVFDLSTLSFVGYLPLIRGGSNEVDFMQDVCYSPSNSMLYVNCNYSDGQATEVFPVSLSGQVYPALFTATINIGTYEGMDIFNGTNLGILANTGTPAEVIITAPLVYANGLTISQNGQVSIPTVGGSVLTIIPPTLSDTIAFTGLELATTNLGSLLRLSVGQDNNGGWIGEDGSYHGNWKSPDTNQYPMGINFSESGHFIRIRTALPSFNNSTAIAWTDKKLIDALDGSSDWAFGTQVTNALGAWGAAVTNAITAATNTIAANSLTGTIAGARIPIDGVTITLNGGNQLQSSAGGALFIPTNNLQQGSLQGTNNFALLSGGVNSSVTCSNVAATNYTGNGSALTNNQGYTFADTNFVRTASNTLSASTVSAGTATTNSIAAAGLADTNYTKVVGAAVTNAIASSTNSINAATLTGTVPQAALPSVVATNNNLSALTFSNTVTGSNFLVLTNTLAAAVDMNRGTGDLSVSSGTTLSVVNVSQTTYGNCAVLITNTSGSPVTITCPTYWYPNSFTFSVTNLTVATIFIAPNRLTNITAYSIK